MKLRFIIFVALFGVSFGREKRSIGSWFSAATTSPLSKYPVWKVHKYTGIALKPMNAPLEIAPGEYLAPREQNFVPKVVQIPDHFGEEVSGSAHLNFDNLVESLPRANDESEGFLGGLDWMQPEAEDKVLKVPGFGHKKKKKEILGLLALSSLLNSGKFSIAKGGVSALLKGIIGVGDGVGVETGDNVGFEAVYPPETTVYRDVPSAKPSFFSKIPFISGLGKGPIVHLPEPVLPYIPALKLVPEPPKLPKLNLPGPYKVPYSTGTYVSIRVPKPTFPVEQDNTHFAPPASSYGVPEYKTPESGNRFSYSHQNSFPEYSPSSKKHEIEYGLPKHAPAQKFTSSAQYPPTSPPAPPNNEPAHYSPAASPYLPIQKAVPSDHYQPQYKYTGPSSYQTTFDTIVSASEPQPATFTQPKNERKEVVSETEEKTAFKDEDKLIKVATDLSNL